MTLARPVIAAALAALLVVGLVWYAHHAGWRLQRAQVVAALATDNAQGRTLEVVGTTQLANAAQSLSDAAGRMKDRTIVIDQATRADPSVAARLPDAELTRLRGHDAGVCNAGSVVCDSAPAAIEPAGMGGGVL